MGASLPVPHSSAIGGYPSQNTARPWGHPCQCHTAQPLGGNPHKIQLSHWGASLTKYSSAIGASLPVSHSSAIGGQPSQNTAQPLGGIPHKIQLSHWGASLTKIQLCHWGASLTKHGSAKGASLPYYANWQKISGHLYILATTHLRLSYLCINNSRSLNPLINLHPLYVPLPTYSYLVDFS